jgi:arabinan endo-1,5-alpha-L-arabinosidase
MRPDSAHRGNRPGIARAFALALALGAPAALVAQTGEIRVHDPVIVKHADTYYVFATGNGIPILKSRDLKTWESGGQVFQQMPEWVAGAVPAARGSLWAPDISFYNGKYHLYYSASSFGSQQSAIGLATNRTLDPASPDYRWEDQGMVVQSVPRVSTFNAIDPNLVMDADGEPWLNWGSFWGGIKMRKVDRQTGKLSTLDTTLYSLASRSGTEATTNQGADRSIEGPFIVRRATTARPTPQPPRQQQQQPGQPQAQQPPSPQRPPQPQQAVPPYYYYLFVSFDRCCAGERSTYNIRVGRSEKVTGPYLDPAGTPLTEGGGMMLLSSHGRVRGPGHNAILVENDTSYYLVHHFYDAEDGFRSRLQIRPLTWVQDWPYAGDPITPPPPGTPLPARRTNGQE